MYFIVSCSVVHLDLHVLTPSFPTRRSSDLCSILRDGRILHPRCDDCVDQPFGNAAKSETAGNQRHPVLQRAFQRRFGTGEYLVHDAAPLFIPRNSKTATTCQTPKGERAHAKISRPPLGPQRMHMHHKHTSSLHPKLELTIGHYRINHTGTERGPR